jgi:hypothetical protein
VIGKKQAKCGKVFDDFPPLFPQPSPAPFYRFPQKEPSSKIFPNSNGQALFNALSIP